jgi:hypothetical protein
VRPKPNILMRTLWALAAVSLFAASGCVQNPPQTTITVSNPPAPASYPLDQPKPLPDQSAENAPQPSYGDPPIVEQPPPEQAWFVNTYNQVGRPRLAVFVNRTLQGDPIAYQAGGAVYLQPGQYDEADLAALDYSEIESLLADWFAARGQVTLVSPDFIRGKLTQSQIKDLQSGRTQALSDLSQATGADVLIQVQAHPARREGQLVILLIGEAVNIRDSESIAHASLDMPAPISRIELNNYTRFLTRKLMQGMVNTWTGAAPPNPSATPAPATQP